MVYAVPRATSAEVQDYMSKRGLLRNFNCPVGDHGRTYYSFPPPRHDYNFFKSDLVDRVFWYAATVTPLDGAFYISDFSCDERGKPL